jgi:hypothetical protein
MTNAELKERLEILREMGVSSASIEGDKLVVAFEPRLPDDFAYGATDETPGGWKTAPTPIQRPPVNLDESQPWGDAPRAIE